MPLSISFSINLKICVDILFLPLTFKHPVDVEKSILPRISDKLQKILQFKKIHIFAPSRT